MNPPLPAGLPQNVCDVLETFVDSASNIFGNDLVSVVLFGSAAEGRLRPLSDVNVLLVLTEFDPVKAGCLHDIFHRAHAAIRLSAMFLLETELKPAVEAFAVKFGDISRRHVVLHGGNPFARLSIPPAAALARLKQVLLNLTLRMRETLVTRGRRGEQMVAAIVETAGPLRACAATLLELQGSPPHSPKEALEQVAAVLMPEDAARYLMERITEARIQNGLRQEDAALIFSDLCTLAHKMWDAASQL